MTTATTFKSLNECHAAKATLLCDFTTCKAGNGEAILFKAFPSPEAVLAWGLANPVARAIWELESPNETSKWAGLKGQTLIDLVTTGRGVNALEAFNSASAKLETHHLAIGGRPVPAIAGGAWVIPAYLASNPLAARLKPRARLPHKDFRFELQCSAYVDQAELGSIGATIARAVWNYTLAGGSATLTMLYTYGFTHPPKNAPVAARFEVTIPLSSENSLALAVSTAFYRPVLMHLASHALSPLEGDSIPMRRELTPPGVQPLRGEWGYDVTPLAALGIKR